MRFFRILIFWLGPVVMLGASARVAGASCASSALRQEARELAELAAYSARKARMHASDPASAVPERHPKIWNPHPEGIGIPARYMESADATRPMPFVPGRTFILEDELSGPQVVARVDASGENAFQARSVEDFLRADRSQIDRIQVVRQYKDGTVTHGPYHTGTFGWDGLRGYSPVELQTGLNLKVWLKNARARIRRDPEERWRLLDLRAKFRSDGLIDAQPFELQLTVHDLMQAIEAAQKQAPGLRSDGKINGLLNVAWQGMLEQPKDMKGAREAGITSSEPSIGQNFSRTRHALQVHHIRGRETWIDEGSLTGSHANINGDWVTERADRTRPGEHPNEYYVTYGDAPAEHEHGYGGRPLLDRHGVLVPYDGSFWMIYERVVEMKVIRHADGRVEKLPWKTQNYGRRMKSPFRFYEPGEKLPDGSPADEIVLMTGVAPEGHPDSPYVTSDRHGMGFLVEGLNLMGESTIFDANGSVRAAPIVPPIAKGGGPRARRKNATGDHWQKYYASQGDAAAAEAARKGRHVILATDSHGNYVEDYGCYLAWREAKDGPIGRFRHVLDETGQPFNFTREFAKRNKMTWVGRADLFYHQGRLWAMPHGVDIESLPQGFPTQGWPAGDQFEYYLRAGLILPLELGWKDGQPWVKVVDP